MKNKKEIYKKNVEELLNTLWNDKSIDVIDHYFSDLSIIDSPISTSIGSNAKKSIVSKWFNALPDVSYKTTCLIGEDNTVMSQWTCKGTHSGLFMGAEATGEIIEYQGTSTFKFSDDNKINYYHAIANITDVMKSKDIQLEVNKTTNYNDPCKIIGTLRVIFNASLNEIEIKVLALWLHSFRAKDIAPFLERSHRTIEDDIAKIKRKLQMYRPIQIIDYLKSKEALTMMEAVFDDITIKNSKPNIWSKS